MKNVCTTHWQVGKIDQLHNLHVTNMSTCDITNINTLENKPFNHFFPIKNLVNFSKISSKLVILQIITTLLQHVVGTECLSSTLSDI
jgi:type III secretory pathway component EscU